MLDLGTQENFLERRKLWQGKRLLEYRISLLTRGHDDIGQRVAYAHRTGSPPQRMGRGLGHLGHAITKRGMISYHRDYNSRC